MKKLTYGKKSVFVLLAVFMVMAAAVVGGIKAKASNEIQDSGKRTVIYYKGYTNPNIHYRVGNGSWTNVPGVAMEATNELAGFTHKYVIYLGDSNDVTVCFNDGNGNWDSKYGENYLFTEGTFTYEVNKIVRLGDGYFTIGDNPDEKKEEPKNEYESIKNNISKLFNDNKEELLAKIKEMRNLGVDDSVIMLRYGSCGPTSIAFQKILLDNGIVAETRVDSKMYSSHEYNLYRVRLSDNSVKFIIIDGSYRQFMRTYTRGLITKETGNSYVTDEDIDARLLKLNLPEVLVYEYGNKEEAKNIIKNGLGSTWNTYSDDKAFNWLNSAYESQTYPEIELQEIHQRYLTSDDVKKLTTGISYDKPYEGNLYLRGSWSGWEGRTPLEYVGNGVYEAKLNLSASNNNGMYEFKVDGNDWNNYIYGEGTTQTLQQSYDFYYNHGTTQSFLTDKQYSANVRMKIDNDGAYTIRIDTRAGVSTPLIRLLNR